MDKEYLPIFSPQSCMEQFNIVYVSARLNAYNDILELLFVC